jgi:hypothetical protein
MTLILSRPKKLDHIDTVRYEIDMLRFTVEKLANGQTDRDAWVYLESFLLHYRNLIEFLGNDKPRPTDLHVKNIWKLAGQAEPANLDETYSKGNELWERYEPSDTQGGGRISQYLQHCTMKRIEAKDWEVSTMFNEIEPLLIDVEKHFGPRRGILKAIPPVGTLDYFAASTTVATMTPSAIMLTDFSKKPTKS